MNKYKGREDWYAAYYKRNKEKYQHNQRKRLYGLQPEQLEFLLISQNNSCAICKAPFSETPHVDHCHITKGVRGLLCRRCNTGLGYYEKYAEQFKKYLEGSTNEFL